MNSALLKDSPFRGRRWQLEDNQCSAHCTPEEDDSNFGQATRTNFPPLQAVPWNLQRSHRVVKTSVFTVLFKRSSSSKLCGAQCIYLRRMKGWVYPVRIWSCKSREDRHFISDSYTTQPYLVKEKMYFSFTLIRVWEGVGCGVQFLSTLWPVLCCIVVRDSTTWVLKPSTNSKSGRNGVIGNEESK